MYDPNQDSLEHYGVLGMKWGVRKDASAASKRIASQKVHERLKKLDAEANAKEEKANKRYRKAVARNKKADLASPINYPRKAYSAFVSSSANRTIARSIEKRTKAKRWANSMEKYLGEAESQKTKLGKKYAKMTLDDIAKANVKINDLDAYTRRFSNRYAYNSMMHYRY